MEISGDRPKKEITYCVTGGSGYIGSWLVKSLLEKGYKVHATTRDPEKASKVLSFGNDHGGRLKVFKADMIEPGSYDAAVEGCDGVFHVAAHMEFGVYSRQNPDSYLKSDVHKLATAGTLNVLEACLKAKTVKRVVMTSSVSIITARDVGGKLKSTVVDESCLNSIDSILRARAHGWVYAASKIIADQTALKFVNEKGLDLVSIIPSTVGGPFLTPTVPASLQVLLSPFTGDRGLYPIITAVNSRLGCIPIVHIEDICDAHIFLMEEREAKGRYICSAHSCDLHQLTDFCNQQYSLPVKHKLSDEPEGWTPTTLSSERLKKLGFQFKHGMKKILKDTVDCSAELGLLSSTPPN
ncbi:putative anthocyanidin reductase [Nymphaea colorata]|nr:putative anthocyanidin reductase [Nymphaea colorata]